MSDDLNVANSNYEVRALEGYSHGG